MNFLATSPEIQYPKGKNNMKTQIKLILFAGIGLIPAAVMAATIYTQDFESFNLGDVTGQGTFTANTNYDVIDSGLGYANGAVNVPGGDQSMQITDFISNSSFATTFTSQSDTVYFALTLKYDGYDSGEFYQFGITNSSNTDNIAGIRMGGNNAINLRSKGASQSDTGSFAYTDGQTARLVMSISKDASTNYNTLKLWYNPTSLTEGAPDGTLVNDIGIASVDRIYGRMGGSSANFESTDRLTFDNIIVGNSYADVVVIPEPGTLALLGIALGGLLLFHRRKG
ncbi:MAG: PEP-CTERM sorting domain-containing protein [Opitutales bacterium]